MKWIGSIFLGGFLGSLLGLFLEYPAEINLDSIFLNLMSIVLFPISAIGYSVVWDNFAVYEQLLIVIGLVSTPVLSLRYRRDHEKKWLIPLSIASGSMFYKCAVSFGGLMSV